jgi:hypothetical protein
MISKNDNAENLRAGKTLDRACAMSATYHGPPYMVLKTKDLGRYVTLSNVMYTYITGERMINIR